PVHLLDLLEGHALVLGEEVRGGALEVHRGVGGQLEGVVGDGDLLGALEGRQAGLELALADVAPGAGDVGPDVYVNSAHTYGNSARDWNLPSEAQGSGYALRGLLGAGLLTGGGGGLLGRRRRLGLGR